VFPNYRGMGSKIPMALAGKPDAAYYGAIMAHLTATS